ncbi:MAG: hypothetical protein EPN69_03145 [Rhodanobacter sp.]|nr:MAG: hypothetical protein EPN69_03145 [Rhodanobacter sp.]TAM39658.1 MAG: hypothetical protein EPN58_12880 [Rhodanobacter sp.]TAN25277.1 MAG: hypothetical protein EPN32_10500 [Rhodanobacter sp.]
MKTREYLMHKYESYEAQGHSIFAVTLSTYVKDDELASSDDMRKFWDFHFIYRVDKCLPYKLKKKFDHDFVVERSKAGHYHYHGLLAFTDEAGKKIWRDGELNTQLQRDLNSFRSKGIDRPFRVNTYFIEQKRSCGIGAWITYITKAKEIPMASTYDRRSFNQEEWRSDYAKRKSATATGSGPCKTFEGCEATHAVREARRTS